MVRTKDWKFVTDPGSDDLDELYDLNTDPWELTNVANDPANIPVISKMRALLMEWATATEDYDPVPLPTTLGRLVYIESEGRWGTARG